MKHPYYSSFTGNLALEAPANRNVMGGGGGERGWNVEGGGVVKLPRCVFIAPRSWSRNFNRLCDKMCMCFTWGLTGEVVIFLHSLATM